MMQPLLRSNPHCLVFLGGGKETTSADLRGCLINAAIGIISAGGRLIKIKPGKLACYLFAAEEKTPVCVKFAKRASRTHGILSFLEEPFSNLKF